MEGTIQLANAELPNAELLNAELLNAELLNAELLNAELLNAKNYQTPNITGRRILPDAEYYRKILKMYMKNVKILQNLALKRGTSQTFLKSFITSKS